MGKVPVTTHKLEITDSFVLYCVRFYILPFLPCFLGYKLTNKYPSVAPGSHLQWEAEDGRINIWKQEEKIKK